MKYQSAVEAQRFSNMQWYLAEAENTVHCILGSPNEMTDAAFRDLLARFVENGPSVVWREDRRAETLVHSADLDLVKLGRFERTAGPLAELNTIDETLAQPFTNAEPASFRATCLTATEENSNGIKTWLIFETSHAMTEGSDISKLLRKLPDDTVARPAKTQPRVMAGELAAICLAPLIGILHLIAAWAWKPRREDFAFARLTLDKKDLTQAARRLGVTKRAMIFGLLTHAILHDKIGRKTNVAYSTLPAERMKLDSENYLNVKMDEIKYVGATDLTAHIAGMHKILAQKQVERAFVHIWQNKVQGLHRWFYQRFPVLYPKHFFDFAPYDLLLSLLPPIRPEKSWANLSGTTVFAGSNTGAFPACIIAIGEHDISLNFWLQRERVAHLQDVLRNASELGIAAQQWDAPPNTKTE